MFEFMEFIFGWRKASKCKKLIRKAHYRLNLLKNRRSCIVKQLRNDVAELIKHHLYQIAFDRADQIYKDECIVAVYDQLIRYCESICFQLSYIRRNKVCPNHINEAISSLIFASARCGDVPELVGIRKLFRRRYGERFQTTALELLPGNFVNFKIIENLSIEKVPDEVKYKLLEEISTTVPQTPPLALMEFTSDQLHQQATDSSSEYSTKEIVYLDDIEEFQPPLNNDENGKDQRLFVFTSSPILPVVEIHKSHQFIEESQGMRMETMGSGKSDHEDMVVKRAMTMPSERSTKCVQAILPVVEIHKNHQFIEESQGSRKSDHEDMIVKRGMGSRAMTMPSERSTKCVQETSVVRLVSLPVQPSPPHVHPNLPDYDELEAMFMALKKHNLQKH